MRKIFLGVIFAMISTLTFGQGGKPVLITGKVNNVVPDKKVYLQFINGRGTPVTMDSANVAVDKTFKFNANIIDGGGYYLLNFFGMELSQKVLLILEGGETVNVIADGMDLPNKRGAFQLTGNSKNIEYFNRILKLNTDLQAKVETWNKQVAAAQAKKDETTLQKIQNDFQAAQQANINKIKAMIPEMGTNLVALWTAGNFLNPENDLETLTQVSERFKAEKPNSPNIHIKTFHQQIMRLKGVEVGSEAPEIAMKTPSDSTLALSSLRGKYVLIDFWASWCGPCRKENPNVVRMYYKFKDKGFDIFSVSLDQEKESWVKAIEKDGLPWHHVSDLQFWNSAAAAAYGVQAIPATFLLDKEGKVIAKFLRGDDLERKLEEVLK
ncbi:TlpA disulfide reductase family protein [Arcicella sp. LKC2W]|jgi:peroxiredoxin|uniref:TlpA disulfide reductase family protein n=1 Tax=Arcicella sp. LKC2W TaxID=2984198 RepID=UPI002B215DF1|nr:TlpA disulfide reductase family protein [Arcicella sp. LKC2W]MEA5461158.1 TlpA disulfide reductase family protein [Arcicella sp. LKC2W]